MATAHSWGFGRSSVAPIPASVQDPLSSAHTANGGVPHSSQHPGVGDPHPSSGPAGVWGSLTPSLDPAVGCGGASPPAQASPCQLHPGQAVLTQHLHAGDGRQWAVAVCKLEHSVLLGVDVEVLGVRADCHLRVEPSDPQPLVPSAQPVSRGSRTTWSPITWAHPGREL